MTDFDSLSGVWGFWFLLVILLVLSRNWDVEPFLGSYVFCDLGFDLYGECGGSECNFCGF